MVVLGLWNEATTGRPEPLIHHPAVHVRLLVATPVFLILDRLFPPLCKFVLAQLDTMQFVPAGSRARFESIVSSASRLSDSSLPELVLALLGFGLGASVLLGLVPISGVTPGATLTAAQIWYALTDVPLFQFLLWRSIWRWLIWVGVLFRLARIRLDLVPTHPDRCGGIRFLRLPSLGYCAALLFAASSVLCAEWGDRFSLYAGLSSFEPLLVVFGVVGVLIAFGPLLLFTPQLARAKHVGLTEIGLIATQYGRDVGRSMVRAESAPTSADIQALANIEQTYRETVKQMSHYLIDRRDLFTLLLATLLPLVPLLFLHVPREDWEGLLSLFTGARP
jgi:hypothetical protein